MKNALLALFAFFVSGGAFATDSQAGPTFNWSDPSSLTPAFSAPTSENRYGEYISNVEFTGGDLNTIHLVINDKDVKEQSQRARFLYGYNTRQVEMRAYTNSVISIWSTKNGIARITFTGPKADENYLEYIGDDGTFKGGVWDGNVDSEKVEFRVNATINCFSIDVTPSSAGVDDVAVDVDDDACAVWYTLEGRRLDSRPTIPGLYVRRGVKATLTLVR